MSEGVISRTPTVVDGGDIPLPVVSSQMEQLENEKLSVEGDEKLKENSASGVNVARAEEQFAELRRELSRVSTRKGTDPEKQDGEEEFDLLEYMRETSKLQDEAGLKHKHVGVAWTDLSVHGHGGKKIRLRTYPDAFKDFVMSPIRLLAPSKPDTKPILHNFHGLAKPGEMVLVLGRPGSGCSTFLKVIANQREGFLGVGGDVEYAGIGADVMKKRFAGETLYNQEDDVHIATLTVAQTLDFALSTKTPGKRLPGQSSVAFRKTVADTLLKMLNIPHTAQTLVGDAFVRGVSGGERKRVSIAEQFAASACVSSWDNSTRGLDASTALDYAKSLRILTDVFQMTNFVSLYQAGEGIYEQFDKVLVIDSGRQVYFGPAKKARKYLLEMGFRDLPRQTTADYLTGCTDPNERQFADGRDETNVPSTPEQLEQAFRASKFYQVMADEREQYTKLVKEDLRHQEEFRTAVLESKRKGVPKKSPYTSSFLTQVLALTKRQLILKRQDHFGLTTSFGTAIAVAIIIGTVYFKQPETASGAFTRGGCLFIALLFNSLNAFSELPSQMQGRPILYKQTQFKFYRPAALALAGMAADIPFTASQIMLFSIIIYFLAGLALSAGAFFTFFLIIYTTFLAMSAFFRSIGVVCQNYDVASRLASVLVMLMLLYGGYLIPHFAMQDWLGWIYWLNPINYGFSALMENEFSRVNLLCDGTFITPSPIAGLDYPATLGPNQVCTLQGSSPGNPIVPGVDYIRAAFGYRPDELWRNFGILCLFYIAFQALQCFLIERVKHGAHAAAITVFADENADTKVRNARLQVRKIAFRKGEAKQDLEDLIKTKKPFTWSDLNYTVPVPGGTRQLLNGVYGYVKPGTLTALMGSSGAGKTTLLDVLANRKSIGVVTGELRVAGRPIDKAFQRGTAYCEQQDRHEWTSTVREALRFSAYLRQPREISKAEKDDYVEEIIQLLEMEDLADAQVGMPGAGLGVEARKRLTIAVELAAKPQLLLFLDEPTSGLDGQSAYNIVRFLRKLAAAGQAILCTIHQPNALLFENFDRLLLLQRGGNIVYFGDIGKDSHHLTSYFARYGAVCPGNANPAEFMLDAIGAGSQKQVGDKDWADIYRESPEFEENKREIIRLNEEALATDYGESEDDAGEYAQPFLYQLSVVTHRTLISFWRMPDYLFTRLFSHCSVPVLTGLTFLMLGNAVQDVQYRVFVIFVCTILPALILAQTEPAYIAARMTFQREDSSKMYSSVVFALSQIISETPNSLICGVVFFLLIYYPAGFSTETSRAGYTFFLLLITEFYSVTLAQAVAAFSPSVLVAALFNPLIMIYSGTFCGVAIPPPNMPHFWRSWSLPLNPFTRLISGMTVTELHGLVVRCAESEWAVFQPPNGSTCQSWSGAFVDAMGGYLRDPSATSDCGYCKYTMGDDFYVPLGFSFDDRWRDLGIFICYVVFNCLLTIVAARFLKFSSR